MLIDLTDDLRCPRAHEETWLVAAAGRTVGRDIMDGVLGCPVCEAEYPIRDGVVWFTPPGEAPRATASQGHGPDPELAMRLAAFLDLSEAHGLALLAGDWAPAALLLRDVVPTHVVLLNATPEIAAGNGVSPLEIAAGIPLAEGTCRGVALDSAHADPGHLEAAVRVLRPRGRLVAPAATPTPEGVTELARDERLWVAEREARAPRLVALTPRSAPRER